MHPSIYREFKVLVMPASEPGLPTTRLSVGVVHAASGQSSTCNGYTAEETASVVERHILRHYPDSQAAAELRRASGLLRPTLRQNWQHDFGDRLFQGLTRARQTSGIQFWAELIPTLPPMLYTQMSSRAAHWASLLGPAPDLHTISRAIRDAWYAVLREALSIPTHSTGLERLALELKGWSIEQLENMTLLAYAQLKEKAKFALLALDYLTSADWHSIVQPLLVPATVSVNT